jgi:DNA-binding transcriptional MerR regulator
MVEKLTIGRVAELSGLPVDTIRFYEKKGLLQPPPRNSSGYRIYQPEAVEQIRFIKRSRDLQFSLQEVACLMQLFFHESDPTGDIKEITEQKIREVNDRLQELVAVKQELEQFTRQCGETSEADPLLDQYLKEK